MKDYSKQIMTILESNLMPDDLPSSGSNQVSELSGISRAVKAINRLVQNEVYGLELQLVYLNEQLSETDSLLIEAKKTTIPRFSHTKSRTRITRMTRAEK